MGQIHKKLTRAQEGHREILQSRPTVVWKNFADGQNLHAHLFFPEGHDETQDIPSVVFFHGGMWMSSNILDLVAWALQLNSMGIACLLPEYRTREQYDLSAQDILQDALDLWSWISCNASGLGLDPTNITLAGVDAGGLMALHAGMPQLPKRSWRQLWRKEHFLPQMPAALAIFRSVIDIEAPEAQILNTLEDIPHYREVNPIYRLRGKLPPLFVAHGQQDPLQDWQTSEWFAHEWEYKKNKSFMYLHATMDHSLMNFHINATAFEQMHLCWQSFMSEQGLWPELKNQERALMV